MKVSASKVVSIATAAVMLSVGAASSGDTRTDGTSSPAASTCTAQPPARIDIEWPSYEFDVTLGSDCAAAGVTYAQWDLTTSSGSKYWSLKYRWATKDRWAMLDSFNPGPVTWKPIAITDTDPVAGLAAISQNAPVSDVRLASGGVMNANRVGDLTKVRVDGYANSGPTHSTTTWAGPEHTDRSNGGHPARRPGMH